MIPSLVPPSHDKFKRFIWFFGLDPAVKVDNFGVVIHGLGEKPGDGSAWNPMLREVFEIDHPDFTEIISWITGTLFRYYPPMYAIIDATRDTPTAQELEKKYGETTVKAMSMTNPGNYEMKQNAFHFLNEGYKFPNTAAMKNLPKARAIADLQLQTLHERVEWTADQQVKFTHPPGAHNDLNRAWEMSLKAVRDFQLGRVGTAEKNIYQDYPDEEEKDLDERYDDMPQGTFALPYREDD